MFRLSRWLVVPYDPTTGRRLADGIAFVRRRAATRFVRREARWWLDAFGPGSASVEWRIEQAAK